ncbi:conserved hypothetical protein [Histoplasma capsulatum G186AR]|uniref:Uncharacterized protein n=1 Tax=Ajellomyces capsulatus (strain G186AR / H82 / ATCC MYA-2454 / RMSCC 2432) TaxID=447093 RepID=C0NVV2_AJECG|nr:uncharacterized protein HCBG_07282 [Histoplasma capsulatum G186AR]EEH04641.1 conserved hypothetical protein [Histoplasma capsulatum G186AR]
MEHMGDIYGHTANPDTMEASRHFRGYAKIDLSHFQLEKDNVLGSRPVGKDGEGQNALRLLKIFESVGCDREDPANYIPVLISQNTLGQAMDDSGTTQDVLLHGINPPNLILKQGTWLLCLQGKSRLRAAQEFFSPALPTGARDRLREKYSNEQNFSDGDIYRNLRSHQLQNNGPRAEAWWARWSSVKCRHVRQMQKQEQLLKQFDRLLPYVGLWAPVNVKLFRRVVDSRCYESRFVESGLYFLMIPLLWLMRAGYSIVVGDQRAASYISYVQLWLCALRLFVIPLKDSQTSENIHTFSSIRGLPLLAREAISLGFNSPEIEKLSNRDANEETCRYFIEHMCQVELYEPEPRRLSEAVRRIQNTLKQLHEKRKRADGAPAFSTNATSQPQCRRYNRPLASHIQNDRCYFFIEHIYSLDQNIAEHPTSIAVTREVLFSFFGKEPIYNQLLELPESSVHEDHPSGSSGISLDQPTSEQTSGYIAVPPASQAHGDHSSGSPDMSFKQPPRKSSLLSSIESTVTSDLSGDPNTRLDIAANRGVDEILNMWNASQDASLIILYLYSSRQFYKFWNNDLALQSTIYSLSKDHFFMHLVGKNCQSLSDEKILTVAKQERLLFVGSKAAPALASVDDIRNYASMQDSSNGKRKADQITRSRQETENEQEDPKRTREIHPQDEMDAEL